MATVRGTKIQSRSIAGWEIVAYRRPQIGEFYLWTDLVLEANVNDVQGAKRYIVTEREPQTVVNYAALLKPAPLTPLKVEYAGQPVLVAEFFDAEGNSSTNTFYDADLAARLYGRP